MWSRRPHPSPLLERIRLRYDASQVFLFDGCGEPMWVATEPVTEDQISVLDQGLLLLESVEKVLPKPFVGHDPALRFSVASFPDPSNLYLVIVREGGWRPGPLAAEAALKEVWAEVEPEVPELRRSVGGLVGR